MGVISVRALLEAGVHFGHQTNRWNPKMKPYIFGARNGVHIVDLQQTAKLFDRAHHFLVNTVAGGEKVLFVGTKRQAQEIVQQEATRAGMPYVTTRWLGGMLTNFKTIKGCMEKLKNIEKLQADGCVGLTKKEAIIMEREKEKLQKNLDGIKNMGRLPGALFVVDSRKEHLAVQEARRVGIPVVAVVDTNCDPDPIDYVISGNDDAIRALKLFMSKAADACLEGERKRQEEIAARPPEERRGGRDDKVKVERVSKLAAPVLEEVLPVDPEEALDEGAGEPAEGGIV